MKTAALFFAASLVLFGVTTAYSNDDSASIRALRMQSNKAIANHDVEGIQSHLYDDYVITISTGAIERTKDEHGKSFAQHFEEYPDVIYIRRPTEVEISADFPLAMEQGTWVGKRTTENGKIETGGRYTAAWRKTESGWRIYSELFVAMYCKGAGC